MSTTETAQILNVTDAAAAKVAELMAAEAEENLHLRVAVRPGGCSGFSYDMFFDTDIEEGEDQIYTAASNVKVAVDSASAQMLQGATLDYSDGLNSTGFAIDNPNASRTCGCGNSFS